MKLTNIGSNQTELKLSNGNIIFFSYETPVACFIPGKGFFKTSTKYSRTTSKHINGFLYGVSAKEVPQEFINNMVGGV